MQRSLYRLNMSALGGLGRMLPLRPIVLCLHSLADVGADFPGAMAVKTCFLEELIHNTRRRGIPIVSLRDALTSLAADERAPFLTITFDDGYRGVYTHAFPCMQRLGAPFDVFITTGLVDRKHPMWWDAIERLVAGQSTIIVDGCKSLTQTFRQKSSVQAQLTSRFRRLFANEQVAELQRLAADNPLLDLDGAYNRSVTWPMLEQMAASGLVNIGAHTVTHPLLSRLNEGELRVEIELSRSRIQECLRRSVDFMAYPFGQAAEVGSLAPEIAAEAGYSAAFTTHAVPLSGGALQNPFVLPRVLLAGKAQSTWIVGAYMSGLPAALKRRKSEPAFPTRAMTVRRISLVVATLGDAPHLGRLLKSLVEQSDPDVEVIIVDQNADDRLEPCLTAYQERLRIIHLRSGPGLSISRNLGLKTASGDLIAFPDDDCWYPPYLLTHVRRRFDEKAGLSGMTCRCTDEQGRLAAGGEDRRSGSVTRRNVWCRGVSATIFVRKAMLEIVGDFNPQLGLGSPSPYQSGEETDFLLRALRLNFQIEYEAALQVYHPLPPSSRESGACMRAWKYGLGMGKVLRMHRYGGIPLVAHLVKPLIGAACSTLMADPTQARVRLARAAGRFQGWRGGSAHARPSWVQSS